LYTPESSRNDFSDQNDAGYEDICTPYHTWSTAAVVISKQGGQKILDKMQKGITQNIDLCLYTGEGSNLNGFALKPVVMENKISVYTNWRSTIGISSEGKRFTKSELYESNE
jgi:hypothetical protein